MSEWLHIAEELPLGGKTRYRHCGHDKDAIVSHGSKYYSLYCFKCGHRDYSYRGPKLLTEIFELNQRAENPSVGLPEDFTTDIPPEHRTWLYRGSVDDHAAMEAGIGWSSYLQRVVLPLYSDSGVLLYWQARAIHKGQEPKYINPQTDKTGLLYRAGAHPQDSSKRRVVVTEDILSAIRVGKHTPAVSILGTHTSDQQAGVLAEYQRVSYWLDPDSAGKRGSLEGCKLLAPVTEVEILTSKKDPKNLPDRVIREVLGLRVQRNYTYHGPLTLTDPQVQG